MKSKSSLFIIIVAVLLIGGGLVYFFMSKDGSAETVVPTGGLVSTNTGKATGTTVAATGTSTGDQVVSLLRNLSTIQLNDAIFQNPSFAMLQDISITLPPVTNQGRRNPFAAVGGDISGVQGFSGTVPSAPVTSPAATGGTQ